MDRPEDLLEQTQFELEQIADEVEAYSGLDRREFVYMSLVAAAASTFGAHAARAQATPASGPAPQTPPAPYALGNADPMSWTFQPYPGGTGALMEKLVRERGAGAFERSKHNVKPWSGPVPTTEEDIVFLPAHRLSALIHSRKITSVQLTKIYLERLKRLNPKLLCAVTIMEDLALEDAAACDVELRAGKSRGPLHGLPYGVKDLFATKKAVTTWGAADFQNRMMDDDAEVVLRLRDAGAVLIAKLSTGLFAQNDWWFRGRTNNPWNLVQGSSGSSAGPGSATAAGCVAFSIGTETQGSIVSPSRACGVSALRPTFGRVSRAGGMTLAWSMDRVGPMCRTIEDCAMVFNAIHGTDAKDPSTVFMPFKFDPNIKLASLKIGFDPGRTAEPGRPADAGAPTEIVAKLRELGAVPKEIGARPTVPGFGSGLNAEYAAAFDDYVQIKAKEIGLDLNNLPEPQRGGGAGGGRGAGGAPAGPPAAPANPMAPADWNPRFVSGRTLRAFEFIQNQRRRYVLITQWAEFMRGIDLFVGSASADIGPNAQTGHPCAVVPYKFEPPPAGGAQGGGRGGAPAPGAAALNPQPICGVITGNLYNDDLILSVAHQFQINTDFHTRRPVL